MGKKITIIALVLVLMGTALPLAADSQIDIDLTIPFGGGIVSEDADSDASGFMEYTFVFPNVKYNYFFVDDSVRIGLGARLFSLIIESAVYPIFTVEADIGPLVLSSNFGGGAFLYFGLFNGFDTFNLYLPEVTVAYPFSDRFSVGTGVLFIFAPEMADIKNFGYVGQVFARFTF